ncbi:MAG: ABC transporter ATP-binding protein [Deltaproteobacteria bacterium]|nr:ABC transporter ATP-binding protein [Deltaproteobacteria bacterium]
MPEAIYQLENVSFAYSQARPVLDQVSYEVLRGSFVCIQGPSGSGKSTLLKLLCRLEEPGQGLIRFGGRPLAEMYPPLLRREAIYIQQTPVVGPGSVRDNLLLPFNFKINADLLRPADERLRSLLDEFQLSDIGLDDPASGMSVGQKQRVCLIRSMLLSPKVMLMDEPYSALDPASAHIVWDMSRRLNRENGITILMVTHSQLGGRVQDGLVVEVSQGKIRPRCT